MGYHLHGCPERRSPLGLWETASGIPEPPDPDALEEPEERTKRQMTEESAEDKQMLAAGLRARKRGDCLSVIVGTDEAGERRLHVCMIAVSASPQGHKTHHCGCCQESWRYLPGDDVWSALGPLTDVVFS